MSHPTSERLVLFLAGELPEAEAQLLEDHIDVCAPCREALSEVVRRRAQDQASFALTHPSPAQSLPVSAGDVVEGRFRIEKLLGVGGMGCVFEAHQTHLNQRVALKFLLPQYARDASVVDRFTREARAAVRLKTEHVGRVLDFGTLSSGAPYLVMELLLGESVDRRLAREGPFQGPLALRIIRDATLALEEAHGLSIVHRDLKPANLFLARRSNGTEIVKVLDFGIAKSVHPEIEAGLTSTSGRMILGTPLYMAPEQLGTETPVDARTDIWALGCVLHQLVTGRPPFEAADLVGLMYAIQRAPHPPFIASASVAAVIDRCLAKAPAGRFESVVALRQQLDAILSVRAPPVAPEPTRSRRSAAVPIAIAVAALVLGAIGWRAFRDPSPAPVVVPEPVAVAPKPAPPEPIAAVPPPVVVAPAPRAVIEAGTRRPAPAPVRPKPSDPLNDRL